MNKLLFLIKWNTYYIIFKMNNLDQYVSVWVDIKNNVDTSSEIRQTKNKYCMIPLMMLPRTGKFIEVGVEWWLLGVGWMVRNGGVSA